MRTRWSLVMAAAVGLILGCGNDNGQNPGPTPITVTVQDNVFSPTTITIPTGTTVRWNWAGAELHDIIWVAPDQTQGAPLQQTGTYQRVFNAAGTFAYYCSIHGTPDTGMRGTVIVQ